MKKKLLVLLLQLIIASAAFAQTHKSKHPVAHKKHAVAAHAAKHRTTSAKGQTAGKHKSSAGHKTASKHGHSHKHGSTASHTPVKRNVHETALLHPNMGMIFCDSVMRKGDTAAGAINYLLSVLKSELGKPYRMGSDGPTSFDCSGLINYAFSYIGISLPRTSADISQLGKVVMLNDLVPGDLLFFTGSRQSRRKRSVGHLGCVYKVDSGKVYMIHSSNEGVNITNITESEYYQKRLICAKRVLATDSAKKVKK
jgi:cell wall-associated NlpC family hydrolase